MMNLIEYNDIVVSEEVGTKEDFRGALELVLFFEEYVRFCFRGRRHFVRKIEFFSLY